MNTSFIQSDMKKELYSCNHCYMLGTLASANEGSVFPGGEENLPITIMKNSNKAMFFIRPLSEEPSPILKYCNHNFGGNWYIGLEGDQKPTIITDPSYEWMSTRDKIEFWHNKLDGKLILFKPIVKPSKLPNGVPYLNLQIIAIEGDVDEAEALSYLAIPRINMDPASFENKLLSQSYVIFEDYPHLFQNPAYVICGDYLYFNFKQWGRNRDKLNLWRAEGQVEDIKRVPLNFNNGEFFNYTESGTQHLEFINEYSEMTLNDTIQDLGVRIVETLEHPITAIPKVATVPTQAITSSSTASNEVILAPVSNGAVTADQTIGGFTEELEFLHELKNITLKDRLSYNNYDLVNFHVSVKTNALTIVAGMSGTGKTQLARAYSKVLGLSEEDNSLLFLPISPSYLEPDDVLGYLNTTTGLYVPSQTGLVDLLLSAEKNPDRLFMVIFDEMNLSQVEHWFAPFLSLMELKPQDRSLKLYSKDSICHNVFKYKDNVVIGDNVIFVGTVNLDETTKDFSDRLLDRANIVTLQKGRFTQLKYERPHEHGDKSFDFQQYREWVNIQPGIDAYTEEELAFFDELHDVIAQYDSQKGVSYRLLNKIGCYINNLPIDNEGHFTLTREDALDLGVKQRLLTKIKGSERQIGQLVGLVADPNEIPVQSDLLTMLNTEAAQKVSHFTLTKKEVMRKALELGIYGYTN